jgi:organic radical activating enzyme
MKKPLPTLSIISKCNNYCAYCFQNDNRIQKSKDVLSFSEIKEVVKWISLSYNGLIILGGEPLLHPEIVPVMKYISNRLEISKLITNLITTDRDNLTNLIEIRNMNLLVNTTTNTSNKKIFDENIGILFDKKFDCINDKRNIAFSLTLTGDIKTDFYYIDNLIEILKKIPEKHRRIRFTPHMPNNENSNSIYAIQNYDKQYLYLLKKIQKEKVDNVSMSFDCGMNNCFISTKVFELMRKNGYLQDISFCSGPFIDITTDLKVLYCHYSSQKYFPSKYYYEFETPLHCMYYFLDLKEHFFKKYDFDCKNINNEVCSEKCFKFCPSIISKILKKESIIKINE